LNRTPKLTALLAAGAAEMSVTGYCLLGMRLNLPWRVTPSMRFLIHEPAAARMLQRLVLDKL
jgi:hypothetical protein